MSTAGFSAFLARKNIKPSAKLYFVDAMSAMAMGLFASLLIGTILDTLGDQFHWDWLVTAAGYASSATGIAIAVAIGVSLSAPPLVLYSLCAVGLGSYSVGGPLGAFFAVIVATELGKAVSRETKVDILVTPTVTILSGLGVGSLIGPGVSLLMNGFGQLIIRATQLRPFLMGIIVSVLVGIVLTLPISSAAICFTLTLTGLAGGAATAGCCAQMIGFAVMSFAENGWGGLVAQGLGTSMLQMGNIVKNPRIWLPPTLAAAITGPVATCIFRLENGIAIASGMGTCGLVGPIGILSWDGFGGAFHWLGLILVCFVLPAVLTPLIALPMRRLGWIKPGDCKLDLYLTKGTLRGCLFIASTYYCGISVHGGAARPHTFLSLRAPFGRHAAKKTPHRVSFLIAFSPHFPGTSHPTVPRTPPQYPGTPSQNPRCTMGHQYPAGAV